MDALFGVLVKCQVSFFNGNTGHRVIPSFRRRGWPRRQQLSRYRKLGAAWGGDSSTRTTPFCSEAKVALHFFIRRRRPLLPKASEGGANASVTWAGSFEEKRRADQA